MMMMMMMRLWDFLCLCGVHAYWSMFNSCACVCVCVCVFLLSHLNFLSTPQLEPVWEQRINRNKSQEFVHFLAPPSVGLVFSPSLYLLLLLSHVNDKARARDRKAKSNYWRVFTSSSSTHWTGNESLWSLYAHSSLLICFSICLTTTTRAAICCSCSSCFAWPHPLLVHPPTSTVHVDSHQLTQCFLFVTIQFVTSTHKMSARNAAELIIYCYVWSWYQLFVVALLSSASCTLEIEIERQTQTNCKTTRALCWQNTSRVFLPRLAGAYTLKVKLFWHRKL